MWWAFDIAALWAAFEAFGVRVYVISLDVIERMARDHEDVRGEATSNRGERPQEGACPTQAHQGVP